MKARSPGVARPCLEELEGRLVPSAVASTSTNWSGYAVNTSRGAVTAVSGSWVVPAATGTGTAYSSDWVGIDGFSSSTVEQVGTDSDIVRGTPQYYAWYEMYPSGSVAIPLAIHAGDTISASVTYGSLGFTLSLTDVTTGQSYGTTQSAPTAARSSAEWIVEAPSSSSGILPLADFGKVTFTGAKATFGGTTGPVDYAGWSGAQAYQINMVSQFGSAEDTTSALTDSGTPTTSSFTVTDTATTSTPTPPSRPRGWAWWWRETEQTGTTSPSGAAIAALLSTGAGSQRSAPLLPAAQQSAFSALPASVRQAAQAWVRRPADIGDATEGRTDQPAVPELLPAPSESGPPGDRPAQPSGSDSTPAPAPETVPQSSGGPSRPSDACFIERSWQPAAPLEGSGDSASDGDDGPGPGAMGLVLALTLGGSWRSRPRGRGAAPAPTEIVSRGEEIRRARGFIPPGQARRLARKGR